MQKARARIIPFVVVSAIGAVIACSDSAKPLGHGDKVIDDTAGQDASQQMPPPPPPPDAGDANSLPYDSGDGYAPKLNTCGGCTCDPTKDYCMSGAVLKATGMALGSSGGFGEPDGATDAGPPPPPCKILPAGSMSNGCTPLPAKCAASPTCNCLLDYLQPFYKCYLVCTPTPGFLEVYCPGP